MKSPNQVHWPYEYIPQDYQIHFRILDHKYTHFLDVVIRKEENGWSICQTHIYVAFFCLTLPLRKNLLGSKRKDINI